MDGVVQANELTGVPTSSSARFNTSTGVFAPVGNAVDPGTQIARTREAVAGMQHQLFANFAVGVDYIYRKYDRGLAVYTLGYQPGAPGYPLQQIYTGPLNHTDPDQRQHGRVLRREAGRDASLWRRQHHDDQPQLSDLPRRRLHRDEALQPTSGRSTPR